MGAPKRSPFLLLRRQHMVYNNKINLILILALIFVLSTADGLITLEAINSGFGKELNPFMDALISRSPWLFMGVKSLLMIFALGVIYKLHDKNLKFANIAIYFSLVLYIGICILHLFGLSTIYHLTH